MTFPFFSRRLLWGAAMMAALGASAQAQTLNERAPRQSVQLAATASVEVDEDWLTLTLHASRQGANAQAVQKQLQQLTTQALTQLKARASDVGEAMRVHTQGFGVFPQYGRGGKITHWTGSVQIVLTGRDFDRISQAAASVGELVVQGMDFSLSDAGRAAVSEQAQRQALAAFNQRAGAVTQGFGKQSWTLDAATLEHHDEGIYLRPQARSKDYAVMAAMSAAEDAAGAPAPIAQPAKVRVRVDVQGTVVLK